MDYVINVVDYIFNKILIGDEDIVFLRRKHRVLR